MKKFLLATCIAALFASCTDQKYDFDNMSKDVHLFDNGIYFPLLTTDIPFSRMIEGYEENIGLQEDGIYFIHSNPGTVDVSGEIISTGDVITAQSQISFSGIPEFLCDDKVNLNMENPAFLARINSNGNIYPISADIVLTPVFENGLRGESVSVQTITITERGEIDIYIAGNRIERIEEMGYTLVECRDMQKLLHRIPQTIDIDVSATSPSTGQTGTIDMFVSYNMDLPLSVESGTTLTYETTEEGLSDVFDVVSVSDLNLIADCINYYPMNIELNVFPYDSGGNLISDIDVTVEGMIGSALTNEPTADIQPSQSTIYIKLHERTQGSITNIDALKLELNAAFPQNGSITKWENITIKLVADAPGGVDIITD